MDNNELLFPGGTLTLAISIKGYEVATKSQLGGSVNNKASFVALAGRSLKSVITQKVIGGESLIGTYKNVCKSRGVINNKVRSIGKLSKVKLEIL